MKEYQREFIQLLIKHNALMFGSFTLKSGRISPYFINAGNFNTGASLLHVARHYANAIADSGIEFDVLFGPAYKGIPLASTVSCSLASSAEVKAGSVPSDRQSNGVQANTEFPFAYDRKEPKDHGEGGTLVGASLAGKRVLIIDDVITAGTAITSSINLIKEAGGIPVGVVVAIDRQEIGPPTSPNPNASAVQYIQSKFNISVISVVQLDLIIEYLNSLPNNSELSKHTGSVVDYRSTFG
ncbi:hypothetical protein BB560_006807, partial [Smittium megazygosporum]